MEEHSGILTRDPIIRTSVSYGMLKTDSGMLSLVCFDVAQRAREILTELKAEDYVTVRGTRQINRYNGQEELVVTYVNRFEEHAEAQPIFTATVLTDPRHELKQALKVIRSHSREAIDEVLSELKAEESSTKESDMLF